jgi:hypothetical protein
MSKPASTKVTADTQEPKQFRTDEQVNAFAGTMPEFTDAQRTWITQAQGAVGNKALVALIKGKSAADVIARFNKASA